MVVVAETSAADLVDVLGKAGAFPIIETRWADAPAAIAEIQPVALAIADPEGTPPPRHVRAVSQCIETRSGPVMPVIALVENDGTPAIPGALTIALDDSVDRLVARIRSALRIRTLHATVLRRARMADAKNDDFGVSAGQPARRGNGAVRWTRRLVSGAVGGYRRTRRADRHAQCRDRRTLSQFPRDRRCDPR